MHRARSSWSGRCSSLGRPHAIPQGKTETQLVERLILLGKKEDRSVNDLFVEVAIAYLDKEEVRN